MIHSPLCDEAHASWITDRFTRPVIMMKRSTSGEKETDITTLIRALTARYDADSGTIVISAVTANSAQQYLNPSYIVDAIARESDLIPSECWHEITRQALLTDTLTEFV